MKNKLEKLRISSRSRLLVVFPHPDDEVAFASGLIQESLRIGAQVRVLILTRGEASTLRHGLSENAELALVRTNEFFESARILGVADREILSFPDKQLQLYSKEIQNLLLAESTKNRITHIVTFEPSGVYGHPDHVFLSQVVTQVVHSVNSLSAIPKNKLELIYATVSNNHQNSEESLRMSSNPELVRPIPANFVLSLSFFQFLKKLQAFRANKSQFRVRSGDIFHFIKNSLVYKEYFYLN